MALIDFSDGRVLKSLEEIWEQLLALKARVLELGSPSFVWSLSLALAAELPADLFRLTKAWRAGSPRLRIRFAVSDPHDRGRSPRS